MKITIGPSSFAAADPLPMRRLVDAGFTVIDNPFKRKLTEDELITALRESAGLIAGLEPITARVLDSCPDLKAVARVGIGMDSVDLEACRSRGVRVSNTPDAPAAAVAEMTLAALLTIARGIAPANAALHAGKWRKDIGFSLKDLKVLLIGAGRIGRRTGQTLSMLGCDVKTHDPFAECDIKDLREGLAWAEVVSLHASGKEEIVGAGEIAAMRDGAVILNCARGGLINEDALYNALNSGKIAACWLDVFPNEPYQGKLTRCENALLTPHTSTYTRQCRVEMEMRAVDNLLRDLGTDSQGFVKQ